MKSKELIKEVGIQLGVGLVAYYLFIKGKNKAESAIWMENENKANGSLIVGDLFGDGSVYKAKYFKDSEYFGRYEKPSKYERNWWVLARMLDKIRGSWGAAITITKGYEPPLSGVITNNFQMCLSVQIYVKDYDGLYQKIKGMVNMGVISPSEFVLMESGQIKLSVNG